MAKAHSVTVTITSTSGNDTNQVVSFTEFASSPEELGALLARETGEWAELVRATGITADP